MANAQWLASQGSAMVLSQSDASANVLLNTIDVMWKKREAHRAAAIRLQKSFITNGAANVVDTLLTQDVA